MLIEVEQFTDKTKSEIEREVLPEWNLMGWRDLMNEWIWRSNASSKFRGWKWMNIDKEWNEAPNQVLLVVFVSAAYYLYIEVERDGGEEESIWRVGFGDCTTLWMCQALRKSSWHVIGGPQFVAVQNHTVSHSF
jgi:hypothetical protein